MNMLDKLKVLVQDFAQSLVCANPLWPGFHDENTNAYAWLCASKDYMDIAHQHQEIVVVKNASSGTWEISRLHQEIVPVNKVYETPALKVFDEWLDPCLEVQNSDSCRIPNPLEDETLWSYLQRLHIIYCGTERRVIWRRSLRSFVDFLRERFKRQIEVLGDLEEIFPEEMALVKVFSEEMDLVKNVVVRKVPKTLFPIDIWTASQIIQSLVSLLLEGRSNAQPSAAKALGLAWVCLAAAFAKCTTRFDLICNLPVSSLQMSSNGPTILVRSAHGKKKVVISQILYEYLQVLSSESAPNIFGGGIRSYRRSFERAVASSSLAQGRGKITFYTFLHKPHEFLGKR